MNQLVEPQTKQDDPSEAETVLSGNPSAPNSAGSNDSAVESQIETPTSSRVPAPQKQSGAKSPDTPTNKDRAAALFAYVQEELKKLPYEEQGEFWDLMWKAFKQIVPEESERDVQDVLEKDETEDDDLFDDSDMLEDDEEEGQDD